MNMNKPGPHQTPKNNRRMSPNQGSREASRASRFQQPARMERLSSIDVLAFRITDSVNTDSLVEKMQASLQETVKEALRETIRETVATPGPHRTWLAEIDRIAQNTDDIHELRKTISAYLRQAGISRIDEYSIDEKRFVITEGEGSDVIAVQPAYVDIVSDNTILAGRAQRIQKPIGPADTEFLDEDIQ
jgi:hypothetical protein